MSSQASLKRALLGTPPSDFNRRPVNSSEERTEQEPMANRPSLAKGDEEAFVPNASLVKVNEEAFATKAKGGRPKMSSTNQRRPREAGFDECLSEAIQMASAGATKT
jgi:hypothetical protein